jgi:hypothetical protein
MIKIEVAFLHEFATVASLTITGDENSITLTKGDNYEAWLNNTTLVQDPDSPSGVSNIAALNRRTLFETVEAWLNGEEYGRQVWTGDGDSEELKKGN